MNLEMLAQSLRASPTLEIFLIGNECLKILNEANFGKPMCVQFREINVEGTLNFLEDNSMEATLLSTLGYTKQKLRVILNEFVLQCYPAETMTIGSFCKFCSKLWSQFSGELSLSKICMMLNCFNCNGNNTLSFKDIALGVCLTDENAIDILQNQSNSLAQWLYQKRFPYLFRYYDLDQDGYLNANELYLLLMDYTKALSEHENNIPPSLTSEQDKLNCAESLLEKFGQLSANGQMLLNMEATLKTLEHLLCKLRSEDPDTVDPAKIILQGSIDLNQVSSEFGHNRTPNRSMHMLFCRQKDQK